MKHLKLIPDTTKVPFMNWRVIAFVFSICAVIASMTLFVVRDLNYGIDFKGGIMLEIGTEGDADIPAIRTLLAGLELGGVEVVEFGAPDDVLIRVERQDGGEDEQNAAVDEVRDALDATFENIEWRRTEVVGPKVAGELVVSGIEAVTFAVIAVLLYIWFRFEWQFGVGAVIALVHDVILTIGFFSITQLEFNLSIIAAILTIVGYSLNDTVVVYDRIRETMRKFRKMDLVELLNLSINATLSRTVMTSVTTLIALVALFFLGGEVIRGFTAAMIWGVFVGTYSSVFIAAPVLLFLNVRRESLDGTDAAKADAARP